MVGKKVSLLILLFIGFSSNSIAQARRDLGSYIMVPDIKYAVHNGYNSKFNMLDVYMPKKASNHPVIVYIHGGDWESGDKDDVQKKPEYFTSKGYLFVSINYRYLSKSKQPVVAQDVADAIVWIYDNIKYYSGDKDNIFLMGYSTGANLAALVSTHNQYLENAKGSISLIKATVLIDGEGYDVPAVMSDLKGKSKDWYIESYGASRKDWQQASPANHVKSGNRYPSFMILYAGEKEISVVGTKIFAKKLQEAGAIYEVKNYPKENHNSINRTLGRDDDAPTEDILRFMLKITSPFPAVN